MAPLLFSLRRSRQLHRQVSKLTQSDIPVYYALNQKTSLQFSAYCPAKEAKRHFNSSSKSPQHPGRLENSTCMITGASSGIGFAIAERMLQEGAEKVILVGRSSERLDNALQRLGQSIVPRPVSTNSGIEPEKVAEGTETNPFATQSGEWGSFYSKLKGQTASQTGVKAGQSSIHREAGVKSSSASAQVIKMSSRVSVMVGDVGDSSFWSGDVKKSMVLYLALAFNPKMPFFANNFPTRIT